MEISVHELIDKIRTLPSADLAELDTFVDYLRFKARRPAIAEAGAPLRLVQLRDLLAGYDTSPESLAALRREMWADLQ